MPVSEGFVEWISPGVAKIEWTATAAGDVGNAHFVGGADRLTVQVEGLAGGGNTSNVRMEGSVIPDIPTGAGTWETLTDPTGGNLSSNANFLAEVQERPRWLRPHVSTATTATGFNIAVIASFPRR